MKHLIALSLVLVCVVGCSPDVTHVGVGDLNYDDGLPAYSIEGHAGVAFTIAGQKCPRGYSLLREYITDTNYATLIIRCK